MTQTHVQMISAVNADSIKKETIDGEDHYRIPSATLPDNVVMNGGLYDANEIAKSYGSLEGTPAPLGHPMIDGRYVSANSQRAMNKYSVGAWNENVRRENGRVLLDKVVNIRVANSTPQGKQLIEAIEKRQPIHTSTGILLEREPVTNAKAGYQWIARNMQFDHDAILLGEVGAATPEQGVGMFVNSSQEQVDVLVANVDLNEDESRHLDYQLQEIAETLSRAQRREENKGIVDKIRDAIKSVLGGGESSEPLAVNHQSPKEKEMTPEELKKALDTALEPVTNALKDHGTSLKEQGEAIKTLQANSEKAAKAEAEREEAERAPLVEKAKAAGLEDTDIKSMSTNALQRIYGQPVAPKGFSLNTAFTNNADEPKFELPE